MNYRFATTAAATSEPRPEFQGRVFTSLQPLSNSERLLAWRIRASNRATFDAARLGMEEKSDADDEGRTAAC